MSAPAWLIKLEEAQFKTKDNKEAMISYLLESPHAKDIPDENKNALLARYGYKPPVPEPTVKRKPGRPRLKDLSNDV